MSEIEVAPRSINMLSHLNTERKLNDYIVHDARKLVNRQEEFLRRLSKIRRGMEATESEIGKINDYYRGGYGGELYTHTLDKAAKRNEERAQKNKERAKKKVQFDLEYSMTPETGDIYVDYLENPDLHLKGRRVKIEEEDFGNSNFDAEIDRLRRRVADIAIKSKEYNLEGGSTPVYCLVQVKETEPCGYEKLYNAGEEVLSGYYEDDEYPEALRY